MKNFKIIKLLAILLVALPFLVCLVLPITLLNGNAKNIFRCAVCRLLAVITRNSSNRLC